MRPHFVDETTFHAYKSWIRPHLVIRPDNRVQHLTVLWKKIYTHTHTHIHTHIQMHIGRVACQGIHMVSILVLHTHFIPKTMFHYKITFCWWDHIPCMYVLNKTTFCNKTRFSCAAFACSEKKYLHTHTYTYAYTDAQKYSCMPGHIYGLDLSTTVRTVKSFHL